MDTNDDARARMRTAERLEGGPSAMSAGEQAAAHAMFRTTDLTPEQAYALARALPVGVDVPGLRHMYAVTSDGEPCTLLAVDVAGVHLLIWTYTAPHSPQVDLFTDEQDRDAAWARAETLLKDKLRKAPGPYAGALAALHGVGRP